MKRRAVHLETVGGDYVELGAVGKALGFESKGGVKTTFKLDSQTCTAELDINSGSVVGSVFKVLFEGPEPAAGPSMVLRREVFRDKEDKDKGLAIEVQLGDEDFDFEIYVDSDGLEPEVKRFLSRPEARAGARWLIDLGLERINVDRRGVSVKTSKTPSAFTEPDLARIYESLLELAKAGAMRGARTTLRNRWLLPVGLVSTAFSGFYFYWAMSEHSGAPVLFGLGAAIFGFIFSRALAQRPIEALTSGHSSSGGTARFALVLAGLTGATLSGSALLFALDLVTHR